MQVRTCRADALHRRYPPAFTRCSRLVHTSLSLGFQVTDRHHLRRGRRHLVSITPVHATRTGVYTRRFEGRFQANHRSHEGATHPKDLGRKRRHISHVLALFFKGSHGPTIRQLIRRRQTINRVFNLNRFTPIRLPQRNRVLRSTVRIKFRRRAAFKNFGRRTRRQKIQRSFRGTITRTHVFRTFRRFFKGAQPIRQMSTFGTILSLIFNIRNHVCNRVAAFKIANRRCQPVPRQNSFFRMFDYKGLY